MKGNEISLFLGNRVLVTKLHPPQIHGPLITRPHLRQRLISGFTQSSFTLVAATAGYGKTTFVVDGIAHAKQKAVWLSLDENDNDPVRFMLYLINAFQTVFPQMGQAVQSLLGNPEPPSPTALITELINELDEVGEPVLLVLDDYHLIQQPYIHRGVEFLLEQSPANLHIVMTTREDPPFPLARWRVKGHLNEFRAADLRFTPVEAAEFFRKNLEISLDEGALTVLAERTEGWIAGLKLAGLSMKQLAVEGDFAINRFINDFQGGHRFVFDYLLSEVLRRYPAETRDFLRQTAILDRFSAGLCAAVTGRRDSRRLLAALEKANLFLVSLDDRREWFRYHHLFADFLRAELSKEEKTALYQSAARWCEAEGLLDEAIQYYIAAADYGEAARLISLTAEESFLKNPVRTWLKWAVKLPPVQLELNPELAVQMAWAHFFTGDPKQTLEIIKGLTIKYGHGSALDLPSKVQGGLLGIQATLAGLGGSPETGVLARKALALIPEDAQFYRALTFITLGIDYLRNGTVGEAIEIFLQVYEWGKSRQHPLLAVASLMNLAFALNIQGRSQQAMQLCTEAFAFFVDKRGKPLPVVDLLYIPLSLLYYQANQVDTASEYAQRGLMIARELLSQAIMGGNAEYVLAKASFALGRTDQALAELAQARMLARTVGYTNIIGGFDAIEAELALKIGRIDPVRSWAAGVAPQIGALSLHQNSWTLWTYARFLLVEKRTDEALLQLAAMERSAKESGCNGRLAQILILQTLGYKVLGDLDRATECLGRAIALAAPEKNYRLFIDEGPEIVNILSRLRHLAPEFVAGVIAGIQKEAPESKEHDVSASERTTGIVERLSKRELEILRLVDAGLTNQEIAVKLVITLGTTKWHLNNIFAKLGVDNRLRAVHRSRELGIL